MVLPKECCILRCEEQIEKLAKLAKEDDTNIFMLEHSRARTLGYIQGMCDANIFDLDVLNELYDRVDAITHPHLVRKKNKKR